MSEKKVITVVGATGAQGGGLVRAIAADSTGPFAVRAITRDPGSDRARALAGLGAEIVRADLDDPDTLEKAFSGAYGAFCVTNFWEHFSPEKEYAHATAMARATKRAGVQHVIWSTLEDTRVSVPLHDDRIPTLSGKYKVPHFDAKGEADAVFAAEAAPTTFLLAAFYWDNFIHFGMGPRKGQDGALVLGLPLGGAPLPGIASADIGKCAYGIFQRGAEMVGRRVGIAGEILTGAEMAAAFTHALGREVSFFDVPFEVYRGLGFPGAEDLGNMFHFQALLRDEFLPSRDVESARRLNPDLLSFRGWLEANASRIPLE